MNNEHLASNQPAHERFRAAFETRQFEIDLFWKRSFFFWGFIAAAFVGIAALAGKQPILSLLISGFGVVCSLAWTLANRGSKYWQEQWETKIEAVEDIVTGPLFKREEAPQHKGWWVGGRRYSVSKLAIAVSDYVLLVWICILFHQGWVLLAPSGWSACTRKGVVSALTILPVIYSCLVIICGRSTRRS